MCSRACACVSLGSICFVENGSFYPEGLEAGAKQDGVSWCAYITGCSFSSFSICIKQKRAPWTLHVLILVYIFSIVLTLFFQLVFLSDPSVMLLSVAFFLFPTLVKLLKIDMFNLYNLFCFHEELTAARCD